MKAKPRRMAATKWFLAIIGLGMLASASFGGWKYLTATSGNAVPVPTPITAIEPEPTPVQAPTLIQEPSVRIEKLFDNAPSPSSVINVEEQETGTKSAETSSAVTPARKAPTGTKHASQDNLLALTALQLHGEAYNRFITQQGMGMSRMVPMVTLVKREWKVPSWTSEELAKQQSDVAGAKDLSLIHRNSINFFENSVTKSDKRPNLGKGAIEKPGTLWEIKSLDLVGLVMHETPTVYISEKIPQMTELSKRPTREMDVFEMEGLEELMSGKDLYIRTKDEVVRVLGPVRAGKACMNCHTDAKEGDMLGAFSYTLRQGQYQMNGRGLQPQGFQGTVVPGGGFGQSNFGQPNVQPAQPMPPVSPKPKQ